MSRDARAYIAAKYRKPLRGLGTFGAAEMSWALAPDDGMEAILQELGNLALAPDDGETLRE